MPYSPDHQPVSRRQLLKWGVGSAVVLTTASLTNVAAGGENSSPEVSPTKPPPPTANPNETPKPTRTTTPTATVSPTVTMTATETPTASPTVTETPRPTVTPTQIVPTVTRTSTPTPEPSQTYPFHYYDDPTIDLSRVLLIPHIYKFRNLIHYPTDWKERTVDALGTVAQFYTAQTLNHSKFSISPGIVIDGELDMKYPQRMTVEQYHFPSQLQWELSRRVYNPSGDLYNPELVKLKKSFPYAIDVLFASSPEGYWTSLVNPNGGKEGVEVPFEYMYENPLNRNWPKLAHEIGHALGLPHSWDVPELNPKGLYRYPNDHGDIMGYNYFHYSLKDGFVRPEMLAHMGLIRRRQVLQLIRR
jgi:hypothetical protein